MIGIRSLLEFNPYIFNNIKNVIRDNILDAFVNELKTEIDVKKAFHYCAKNANKEECFTFMCAIENRFDYMAELYDYYVNWCHDCSVIEIEQNNDFDNISGLISKENEFTKESIIHL